MPQALAHADLLQFAHVGAGVERGAVGQTDFGAKAVLERIVAHAFNRRAGQEIHRAQANRPIRNGGLGVAE